MALNLESIFKITAKVRDEGLAKLASGLERADKAGAAAKKTFRNITDSSTWQASAVAAGAIGLALAASVRSAIEFESAVADVRKVVDGIDTPQGLKEIREEIIGLSLEMPIAAKGFAQIYAAAGESGIARNQIKEFAVDVAKMAVAFDMTAEEAGDSMAKIRSALGLSQPEMRDLADAMNYLSNNAASSGAQLVEFTKRSGAMGQMAGLTAEQTAAFGSAMIGAGVETEVAATSFNNMVRALSRGASVTARQQSALERLGLASRDVADGEKRMTAEVQRQSDRRLEIMQDATDRQLSELRKRYRRQLQLLEDQWDDESEAFEEGVQDQSDAQIKALQKQADARIKEIQRAYADNADAADQQADLIRDQLEKEIDAIRDAADDKLKVQRRADRDRRDAIREDFDERADIEAKALQRALKQQEEIEKQATKEQLDRLKESAGDGGSEAGKQLARRLQEDALGTIRDVFKRIKGLAADEQISVISDLFGDEARGLAPMINNLGALETALGLVADKTKYAGSMTKEYEVRAQTSANALQLAKNNFDAFAITIGASVVPALTALVSAATPVVSALLRFAQANPAITSVVVAVTALGAAFVLAAPFVMATITLISTIGIATLGPIAAVVAAVVGIGVAFKLLWDNFVWFRDSLTAGLAGIIEGWRGALTIIQGIIAGDSAIIEKGWNMLIEGIKKSTVAGFEFAKGAIGAALQFMLKLIIDFPARIGAGVRAIGQAIGNGISSAVRSIITTLFNWIGSRINGAVNAINFLIRAFNRLPGPNIPTIANVPRFAKGGFVEGPTIAMLGDNASRREYAVPEEKAIGFANNILAGRRGASAIPASPSTSGASAGGGGGALVLNLTTGPVRQDATGQRWMTIEDGERMLREGFAQMQRVARTPGGRYSQGIR
jgi:TP901 family phage tail tape measure protein